MKWFAQVRRALELYSRRPDAHTAAKPTVQGPVERRSPHESRSLGAGLGGLGLDLKLGLRMLSKYPGFAIVGGLTMALSILFGAVTFVMVTQFVSPRLPLPDGDRIVEIRNWDTEANQAEERILTDFLRWRQGARSVTDLGAYRDAPLNLTLGENVGRPVRAAEISAVAFRIAPERPILGRALLEADERVGSPPVVVLGYELWRTRFAEDAEIIGRSVRVGGPYATVVGVMPKGFSFPVAHELWVPLRPDGFVKEPREGPEIQVFGRLAPGYSLKAAKAELSAFGRRAARESPTTHGHLQPVVRHYAQPSAADVAVMFSINLFAVILLVFMCSNVALLAFARAASREDELVVRSALGASQNRIVAQLFIEALVLGVFAAAAGLGGAHLMLRRFGVEFLERNLGALPFWFHVGLSAPAVLYAALLTLLAATITGVVPARKITSGLGAGLKQRTAGGGGVQFGGVWTAVIVGQIALTVAFPILTTAVQREANRIRSYDVGVHASEFLAVSLDVEVGPDSAAHVAHFRSALQTLARRVDSEPGVDGVTFVDRLPGDVHRSAWIEFDAPAGGHATSEEPEVSTAVIDGSYFDVLGAPMLAGRGFGPADMEAGGRSVVVDRLLVDRMLHGRNPVGMRLRFVAPPGQAPSAPGPWYEIIGVARDLGMSSAMERFPSPGVYLAGEPGALGALHMLVHTRRDPSTLASRIRVLATETDAALRVSNLRRLDRVNEDAVWGITFWVRITMALTTIAILLSLAGIYAVMSFTVVRRTREIGVRVALGASPWRVVLEVFRKPLGQIAAGITMGFVVVTMASWVLSGYRPDGRPRVEGGISLAQLGLLTGFTAATLAVCLLACVIPTRRALRVQPSEALRMD